MRFAVSVLALAAAVSAYQPITQIGDGQLQAPPAPTPSGRPAPPAPPNAPPGPMSLAPMNSPVLSEPQPPPTEPRPPLHPLPKPGSPDAPPPPAPPAPPGPPAPSKPLLDMSAALSNLRSQLAHLPTPSSTPSPQKPTPESQHNTPSTLLACTSTCYTSWSGDSPDAVCDVLSSKLKECRNFSDALAGKVVAVRPDKGQVCLLYEERDCGGRAEWVKWPGVKNLRGRVSESGGWTRKAWSWVCDPEADERGL